MGRVYETFLDGVGNEREQWREVRANVEQANGLGVDANLRPSDDLEQLVEGAEAAGQSNESVGKLGHHRLAFVHPAHFAQLRQVRMRHPVVAAGA